MMDLRRALRMEWTKLRSVRSTTWSLLAIAALTIVFGAVSCSTSHTEGIALGDEEDVVTVSLVGVYFAQIAAVSLGALAVGSEYATGTIRPTFVAQPRRRTVLSAKVAIVVGLVLGVCVAATVIAFYAGQAILRGNGFTSENGYPAVTLADGSALRTVAIVAVYPALVALLSLALAVIVRHTATAISVLLGLLLVPFIVGALLPHGLGEAIQKASPMVGLAAQERGAPIGPWAGFAVTAAWAAAALLVALWLIRRRDA